MSNWVTLALRVVIAGGLLGSLLVQALLLPSAWRQVDPTASTFRLPVLILAALVIVAIQACAVCVWQLVGMVRRGTVFSPSAFRWVDAITVALLVAAILSYAAALLLAPGALVAPGVAVLVAGAGSVFVGFALIVLVMRALLAQAVARDRQARELEAELDEVI